MIEAPFSWPSPVQAAVPGARILNAADPDAPNGLEISRIVARSLGHSWREVLLDGDEDGRHPWHRVPPVVLDTGAAVALGYERSRTVWRCPRPPFGPAPPGFDQVVAGSGP